MKKNCLKCEYEWMSRMDDREPIVCPRCRSRKWNTPKEESKGIIDISKYDSRGKI